MLSENKALFDDFRILHEKYSLNTAVFQAEYNEKGKQILEVIRKYEMMLCSQANSSSYGKYSSNLADKFWSEIRKEFPKINFIGVE